MRNTDALSYCIVLSTVLCRSAAVLLSVRILTDRCSVQPSLPRPPPSFSHSLTTACFWPGWISRYSDSLRTRRSGDQVPAGARYSIPLQTGPGAHPPIPCGPCYYWGLAPRLKKEPSHTSPLPSLQSFSLQLTRLASSIADFRMSGAVPLFPVLPSPMLRDAKWSGRERIQFATHRLTFEPLSRFPQASAELSCQLHPMINACYTL